MRNLFAPVALVIAAVFLASSAIAEPVPFHLYVSNERDGTVSVIDGTSLQVRDTISVGERPRGLHVSPDGMTLCVATSGSPRIGPDADSHRAKDAAADTSDDGIAVVDLAMRRVTRRLQVGSAPEGFAVSRDGRHVIVANEDIATASIWEVATNRAVGSASVTGEPTGVALHPLRDEVWVSCAEEGDIYVLHPESAEVTARIRLGGRPRAIVFSPAGDRAYVSLENEAAVAIIDADVYHTKQTVPLPPPAQPMGSAISFDGSEVYLSTGHGNHIAILDTAAATIVATVPVGERPSGIALSPAGALLLTANGGSNDVSVVDVRARKEVRRIAVGDGPWGLAIR